MMIKNNELRIGNWVLDGDTPKQIVNIFNEPNHETPYMNPIPLTEEWLIKLGFNLDDVDFYEIIVIDKDNIFCSLWVRIEYGLIINLTTIDEEKEEDVNIKLHNIKHVHQLQNLYFALTNTELTIK